MFVQLTNVDNIALRTALVALVVDWLFICSFDLLFYVHSKQLVISDNHYS